jgi:hypothetical protein
MVGQETRIKNLESIMSSNPGDIVVREHMSNSISFRTHE